MLVRSSQGSELASKGRELANHFLTEGTPIMIGKMEVQRVSQQAFSNFQSTYNLSRKKVIASTILVPYR